MKTPQLLKTDNGYAVNIRGAWHHGQTEKQARSLLLDAGLHSGDITVLIEYAPRVPSPVAIEYVGGHRPWLVDGRPSTREWATIRLREAGMSPKEAKAILRIHRFCYTLDTQYARN